MMHIKKNFLRFLNSKTGAISPVEVIEAEAGYTPADYLKDYKTWCDKELENIYDNGVIFFKIEE